MSEYSQEIVAATCEKCPLRSISEEEWALNVRQDVETPYYFGVILKDVLSDSIDPVDMDLSNAPVGYTLRDAQRQRLFGMLSRIDEEAVALEATGQICAEGIVSRLEELGHDYFIGGEQLVEGADSKLKAERLIAFLGCLNYRLLKKNQCEASEEAALSLPIRVDLSFGADVLDNIARFGSNEEVAKMSEIFLEYLLARGIVFRMPWVDRKGGIDAATLDERREFLLVAVEAIRPHP